LVGYGVYRENQVFEDNSTPDRYVAMSDGDNWLVWRLGLESAFVTVDSWESAVAHIKSECLKYIAMRGNSWGRG
jgi:hypothetical protein